MKQGIHPEYVDCVVKCSCGNTFTTRSTKPELKIDICNACHPFYTGTQKLIDTGGRVQRFADRFGAAKDVVAEREAAKKAEREAKAAAKAERAAAKAAEEAARAEAQADVDAMEDAAAAGTAAPSWSARARARAVAAGLLAFLMLFPPAILIWTGSRVSSQFKSV